MSNNDICYLLSDGEPSGVCIKDIEIRIKNDKVTVKVSSGSKTSSIEDFNRLLIAYLEIVAPDQVRWS